jgi:glycosyltransferase 2 family protein
VPSLESVRSHAAGRYGLKLLVSAGLLYVLFRVIPLRDILRVVATASGGIFAAGMALQFANRGLSTLALKVITASQGIELSRRALFRILLAVQFYSLLLPGALAGGGATWLKYLEHGADKRAAAATVVINRAVALLILVPVGTLGFVLDQRLPAQPPVLMLSLIATNIACAFLLWYPWPRGIVTRIAGPGRWRRRLAALIDRLTAFQRMPTHDKATVVGGAIASELGNVAAMWTFAQAVGVRVDFVSVLWMRGLLETALLLPLSVAGLGVREISLVGLGALVGVPAAAAVAWSLAILAGSVGVALAGGLLEATGWAGSVPARAAAKP